MVFFYLLLLFTLGAIFGSFLTSLTYRTEHEISLLKGRSFCPKCKKTINWYDNIPLLSYFILQGKCRHCHKKISVRYPIIELATAIAFVLVGFSYVQIYLNLIWLNRFGIWGVSVLLLWTVIFIGVAITDIEDQIIPDELVFWGVFITFTALLLASSKGLYVNLLAGAVASNILLFLNLVTKGRGMGLGDVKLAFLAGLIFGPVLTFSWLFLGFILGAIIGIALILTKRAKFKAHIAFGPFLVASFFIILFWGSAITRFILPL